MADDEVKNQADQPADEAPVTSADLDQVAAAEKELSELRVKLTRWQADYQNLQRRAAREVLDAKQNADADFAKSMLQVLDHFDMALAVDPSKVDAAMVLNGIKITYDELKKLLDKAAGKGRPAKPRVPFSGFYSNIKSVKTAFEKGKAAFNAFNMD